MISLINVIQNIVILPRSNTEGIHGHTYAVVNDMASIATQLPRMPDASTIAILRTSGVVNPHDLTFRPHVVKAVLESYMETNDLYRDVQPVYNDAFRQQAEAGMTVAAPAIIVEEADLEGLRFTQGETAPVGTPTAAAVDTSTPAASTPDILLFQENGAASLMEQVVEIAHNQQGPPVLNRDQSNSTFVDARDDPLFEQKAFPMLYPCGSRGGPNNPHDTEQGNKTYPLDISYIRRRLNQGHTRTYQRCNTWIFYHYSCLMKLRMGGVAFTAAKMSGGQMPTNAAPRNNRTMSTGHATASAAAGAGAVNDTIPTVSTTQSLLDELQKMHAKKGTALNVGDLPVVSRPNTADRSPNTPHRPPTQHVTLFATVPVCQAMRKMIGKMKTYATALPGSPLYMM
jgi:hypothetical protein